jgi:ADP-L-glycero-D-manno-heptose 6-epimerase
LIIVTGAAGFIGSVMIWKLNQEGIEDILLADSLYSGQKWMNLRKRIFNDFVDKNELFNILQNAKGIDAIIHLGACTDTTEKDVDFLIENNYLFSKRLWKECVNKNIPFLYASSGATYGGGEMSYSDDIDLIPKLKPLNPYGWSKQLFDRWVLKQEKKPTYWYGFKFFNVYGPNEYHKGQMASVIFHAFNQVKKNKKIKLFKSYKENYNHGDQKRDFIYVKDIVSVMYYFYKKHPENGIYNVGTGKANTFKSLAKAVFDALDEEINIEYIDMPSGLKDQYQYFTEANISKLQKIGYNNNFYSLDDGVKDYIQKYLNTSDRYL